MKDYKPADYILDDFCDQLGVKITFDAGQQFLVDLREAFRQEEEYGLTMAEAKTLTVAVQEFADRHGISLEEAPTEAGSSAEEIKLKENDD